MIEINEDLKVNDDENSYFFPTFKVSRAKYNSIHRFYDSSPISPSGKYIAITEFLEVERLPKPGDAARIVVIDLSLGSVIYSTKTIAWDTQVGSHVQWGRHDKELFFNRLCKKSWKVFGCKVNIFEPTEKKLEGTIYMVSNCGKYSASPSIEKLALVQPGYGIHIPKLYISENLGAPADDGLFITNNISGKSSLLISFSQIYDQFRDEFKDINLSNGGFYGFHVKWSCNDKRLAFIVRWLPKNGRHNTTKNYLISCDIYGNNLKMAVNANRWRGGHHPTWCPDEKNFVMNLAYKNKSAKFTILQDLLERIARKLGFRFFSNASFLRIVKINSENGSIENLFQHIVGSGHPTFDKNSNFVVTDSYINERTAYGDGSVPIRLINLKTEKTKLIARINVKPTFNGPRSEYRVDPHPAWNKTGNLLVFNGISNGIRSVFVADMSEVVLTNN